MPAEPPRPGSGLAWRIEPLGREHDRSRFDCGEPALNEYLVHYARQNQESGIARTFVAVVDEESNRILGYYSLTVAGIDKANLPQAAIKRFPNYPIPVVRLACLAVDRGAQGCGLGEDLLMDALTRCLRAAREIGIAAVLVDAKHDRAKRFYARYEFESLPGRPLTLWLPMASVRRLFGEEGSTGLPPVAVQFVVPYYSSRPAFKEVAGRPIFVIQLNATFRLPPAKFRGMPAPVPEPECSAPAIRYFPVPPRTAAVCICQFRANQRQAD